MAMPTPPPCHIMVVVALVMMLVIGVPAPGACPGVPTGTVTGAVGGPFKADSNDCKSFFFINPGMLNGSSPTGVSYYIDNTMQTMNSQLNFVPGTGTDGGGPILTITPTLPAFSYYATTSLTFAYAFNNMGGPLTSVRLYYMGLYSTLIAAISPSCTPVLSGFNVTATFRVGVPSWLNERVWIAFSNNPSCTSLTLKTFMHPVGFTNATVLTAAFQSGLTDTGTYYTCLSLDGGGHWARQTYADFSVYLVDSNFFGAAPPQSLFANGTVHNVSFAGSMLPPKQSVVVFAPNKLCDAPSAYFTPVTLLSGPWMNVLFMIPSYFVDYDQSSYTVYPCLRTGNGAYAQQTAYAVRVATAQPLSITAVAPSTFVVSVNVAANFQGIVATGNTRIGFSTDHCATVSGPCQKLVTASIGATTVQFSGCTFPNATTLSVCYMVNSPWVEQLLVSATVITDPLANSITGLTPNIVGVGMSPLLTVSGITANSSSMLGFSNDPATGCSACTSTCKGKVTLSQLTLVMSALPVAYSAWIVCYSANNGSTWSQQVNAAAIMQSIDATALSISGVTPTYGVQGQTVTLTFDGVIGTETTRLALANGTCMNRLAMGLVPAGNTSIDVYLDPLKFKWSQIYWICYSTNNGTSYVPQTSAGFYVYTAVPGSIARVQPNYFGAGIALQLVLTGDPYFATGVISFASDCTNGPYYSNMSYTPISTMTAPIPAPGFYYVCYSVRSGAPGSWVQQSLVNVTVVVPAAGEVTDLSPTAVGSGVISVLNITLASGRVPQQSLVAAVSGGGSNCAVAGQRQMSTKLGLRTVTFNTSGVASGAYTLCISYNNGVDWVAQTGVTLNVIAATSTSITTLAPLVFENEVASIVTLTAPITPTNVFAFALAGNCSVLRYAETPFLNGTVQMASPLDTGMPYAILSVCFSVDGGLNWVEQTLVHATAITACDALTTCESCHANTFCTWCLTDNSCAVQIDSSCPGDALVAPGDIQGCPVISFPNALTGSSAGGSNVSILSTNDRLLPLQNLVCLWDFTIQQITTPFTVVTPGSGWCVSPPTVGLVAGAYLSLSLYDTQYTVSASSQRGLWIFYDCTLHDQDVGNCDACHSSAKPECGMCLRTSVCQTSSECADRWAGSSCPSITSIDPAQLNFRGDAPLSVHGALFINSTGLVCEFDGISGGNASFVSATEVTCEAPPGAANTLVQVGISYHGFKYTSNQVPLLYLPDPAAIVQAPGAASNDNVAIVAPLVAVIGALVAIVVVVAACLVLRQRRFRRAHMPPVLSAAVAEAIAYGEAKPVAHTKEIYPLLAPLMQLIVTRGSALPAAMAKAVDPTESDGISKALVHVCEANNCTVEVMKGLVNSEVAACEFLATLFRTNSFVTKMFKTYSKVAGLHYLHQTLGYELNASLASTSRDDGGDLDVKDDSNDDVQLNKLLILTVCQRVFLAITKSEDTVPATFSSLFQHVRECVDRKFPPGVGDVTRQAMGSVIAYLAESQLLLGSQTQVPGLQQHLLRLASAGDAVTRSDAANVVAASDELENVMSKLAEAQNALRDLVAGCDPTSDAARKLVASQEQNLNSIVVGGFFFLRFVVPAITAPHSYALMREPPNDQTMKVLVLCGKVIQNLSNDKDMGGKEAFMAKMNEFIVSNRKAMHDFQAHLVRRREAPAAPTPSVPVPTAHLEASSMQLYNYTVAKLATIITHLEAIPGQTPLIEDLLRVMDGIQAQAGANATEPRSQANRVDSIRSRRRSSVPESIAAPLGSTSSAMGSTVNPAFAGVGDE